MTLYNAVDTLIDQLTETFTYEYLSANSENDVCVEAQAYNKLNNLECELAGVEPVLAHYVMFSFICNTLVDAHILGLKK